MSPSTPPPPRPRVPRSARLLAEFTRYCEAHPQLRFWQALCAWTGARQIRFHCIYGGEHDVFYWEERRTCPPDDHP